MNAPGQCHIGRRSNRSGYVESVMEPWKIAFSLDEKRPDHLSVHRRKRKWRKNNKDSMPCSPLPSTSCQPTDYGCCRNSLPMSIIGGSSCTNISRRDATTKQNIEELCRKRGFPRSPYSSCDILSNHKLNLKQALKSNPASDIQLFNHPRLTDEFTAILKCRRDVSTANEIRPSQCTHTVCEQQSLNPNETRSFSTLQLSSLIRWKLSSTRVAYDISPFSSRFKTFHPPFRLSPYRASIGSAIPSLSSFVHVLLPLVALLLYFVSRFSDRSASATTQKSRRQTSAAISGKRLQYVFLLHFLSFLACCIYASSSSSSSYAFDTSSSIPTSSETSEAKGTQSSVTAANPFSRHSRHNFQSDQICHVWNSHSPKALCSKGRWSRLRLMREILLFSRDCDEPSANIYLGELFRLDWHVIRTETDLVAQTQHLRPGIEGRDCVLSPLHSSKCHACFARIATAMAQLDAAYMAFEHTLRRFDCLLAVDFSSATRPFSPNGTCVDCKVWYRKWLLVELVRVWRQPPCINWCFYTQLACPHFGTSKVVDFAGHPAFMCRDLSIPQISTGPTADDDYVPDEDGIQTCNCVHPCDLQRDFQPSASMQQYFTASRGHQSEKQTATNQPYDFYASIEHCWARRRRCRAKLVEPFLDGVSHSTASRFNAAVAKQRPDRVDQKPERPQEQQLNAAV